MEKKMETAITAYIIRTTKRIHFFIPSTKGQAKETKLCYHDMGGCQNYGPFLGTLNIRGRIIPKRDHNFDNHPYKFIG